MEHLLKVAVKTGKIAGAYMLVGSGGIVEKEAEDFISYLMCENNTACGVCPACKKLRAGVHADVIRIQKSKKNIVVEDIQHVPVQASQKAFEGGRKVFFIPDASSMNEQAQNKLLKIIEEPPENTVFLLGLSNIKNILPTIVSRCIIIKIQGNDIDAAASYLKSESDIGSVNAFVLAKAASGDKYIAKNLLDEDYLSVRNDMLQVVSRLINAKNKAINSMLEKILFYENALDNVFLAFDLILHDCLMLSLDNRKDLYNADAERFLVDHVKTCSTERITKIIDMIEKYNIKRITCQGIAKKMLLASMLIEILEKTV